VCPGFFEVMFFQDPFPLSFAIAFVSYLVQFSWHPLLDFYGVSMGCLKLFYGISMEFCRVSLMFYGVSKGCLWYFYGIPMGFQKDVYGISFGFLWYVYDISMGFLWDFHDVSIGFI